MRDATPPGRELGQSMTGWASGLPERVGGYRIAGLLGQGGMGTVYEAVSEQSGERVALKTVRVPRAWLMEGIRREIAALRRLAHPGVVRVLDEGVQDGLPWYAMPFLHGVTLRERLLAGQRVTTRLSTPASQTTAPLPGRRVIDKGEQVTVGASGPGMASVVPVRGVGDLVSAITLVRRLCAPLAYIHGEGVVHRDLKPENVVVLPDGMPVLMDFGLVTRFFREDESREGLELDGEALGTVLYMAPEQGLMRHVDARADVYSLGCILFELLTGRPPFSGDTTDELLERHRSDAPARPGDLAAGIPPALDDLALAMLAKDPRDRPATAQVVGESLRALGARNGAGGAKPRAFLYRTGFVGRETVLASLEQRVGRTRRGSGGIVILGGESGVGKTRLLLAIASHARRSRLFVVAGECRRLAAEASSEEPGGAPLQPLVPLFRAIADRCVEGGESETDELLGARGPLLAGYSCLLADLPGQSRYPAPAALPPAEALMRLHVHLCETVEAFASPRPLLLLLDDLQWADELTLGWLRHVSRGWLTMRPVLIVATYRAEERTPAIDELLDVAGSVRVPRLADASVRSLVAEMLAVREPPRALTEEIFKASEGNPFFVAEYLRTAIAEGLLERDAWGRWQLSDGCATIADLPRSLRTLVSRRLAGLGQEATRIVRIGSALGREVAEGVLAKCDGGDDAARLQAVNELLARNVLEAVPGGLLRFTHDKLREAAYESIPAGERPGTHRCIAMAIEEHHAPDRREHLPELGHHWERAGCDDRARPCYLDAAGAALAANAHGEAEVLLRKYLGLVREPTRESVAARNTLGSKVLRARGRLPDAVREHERALEEARAIGELDLQSQSHRMLGAAEMNEGRVADAIRSYESGLAIDRQTGDRRAECEALIALAAMAGHGGGVPEADAWWERSIALGREVGDAILEASALRGRATLAFMSGDLEKARGCYERALHLQQAAGSRFEQAITMANMSVLSDHLGEHARARELCEEALGMQRQLGNRIREEFCLGQLGAWHRVQGRYAEARENLEAAHAMALQMGHDTQLANWLGELGNVHRFEGRLDAARALYGRAIDAARKTLDRRLEGWWIGAVAAIDLEEGELDRARSGLDTALAIAREIAQRNHEAHALWHLSHLARFASSDREEPLRLATAALHLVDPNAIAWRAAALCEQGHALLHLGRTAREAVARVAEIVERLGGCPPASELGGCADRLRKAQAAFDGGAAVVCGSAGEDITEGQRRWLATRAVS
ncbi:MAG: tetratricopeptide repeat protein [Acidobacteriota bacterium]